MIKRYFLPAIAFIVFFGCQSKETKEETTTEVSVIVNEEPFGVTTDGDSVTLYTFANQSGMEVKIMNYGGIVTHLSVPDKNDKVEDVVLGFDDLDDYLKGTPYFGALVGRYGNRIAKGKFMLNGEEYTLVQNNGENHLHGGIIALSEQGHGGRISRKFGCDCDVYNHGYRK